MKTYKLYAIFNTINNKMYFGITCNPTKRLYDHKKYARRIIKGIGGKNCFAIHYAMAKYDIENFIFKIILDDMELKEALEKEVEFIKIAKECGYQLYNETDGGEGIVGYKMRPLTEEQRKKLSERMSGSNNPMYGVKLFGTANGNYGKQMKPHVKEKLLKIRCKLTKEQVEEIRQLYSTKEYTQTSLSKKFNISLTQIHRIVTNQRWTTKNNHKIKPNLKQEQIFEIIELYKTNNYTQKELAIKFKISDAQISRIIKKWKSNSSK